MSAAAETGKAATQSVRRRVYRRILLLLILLVPAVLAAAWLKPLIEPPPAELLLATNAEARAAVRDARQAGMEVIAVPVTPLVQAYVRIHRGVLGLEGDFKIISTRVRWDGLVIMFGLWTVAILVVRQVRTFDLSLLTSVFTDDVTIDHHASNGTSAAVVEPVRENLDSGRRSPHDVHVTADPADAILRTDVDRAAQLAAALYSRSTLLLAGGIVMAFVGIGVFWASLPTAQPDPRFLVSSYVPQAVRALGMLVFIEAIAWFLLRQYRSLMEDYKSFHRVYLRRVNVLAALKLASPAGATAGQLSVAAALLFEDLSGRLRKDETTESLEATKLIEPNPVIHVFERIIDRAAAVSSDGLKAMASSVTRDVVEP